MLFHHSNNKMVYPIHLPFSVGQVQTLMVGRNDNCNCKNTLEKKK